MRDETPTCRDCGVKMGSYDADRGYGCINKKCPRNIAAEAEQQRYNKSCRLHGEYVPLLSKMPATLFTVEEIGWITSRLHSDYGFELEALYKRLTAQKQERVITNPDCELCGDFKFPLADQQKQQQGDQERNDINDPGWTEQP
jgi:hypothetical protein